MPSRRTLATAAALPLALAACTGTPASAPSAPTGDLVAVATTTQLGSILGDITACAGTSSATLMGPGDDPHDFSASSSQVVELTKAKLVVANGLTLEGGLESTLEGAKADGATILEVAPLLDPLSYSKLNEERSHEHEGHAHAADAHADEHADDEGHEGHDHGDLDPHVSMDVGRMARAASLIGAELAKVTGDEQYTRCGAEVETKLKATDAEVRQILGAVPAEKRKLVVDHEAYNYFADAYDFTVAGAVVKGGSTDAEPSSAELAELVALVKEDHISAIFSNNAVNPKLIEAVAAETGTQLKVVEVYVGSVGPAGSGADTYAGMMTTNARRIVDALK